MCDIGVQLSFTLLTTDPSILSSGWNIKEAIDGNVSSLCASKTCYCSLYDVLPSDFVLIWCFTDYHKFVICIHRPPCI